MAKKTDGGLSQQDKIKDMIAKLGWEASPDDCVKYLKETYDLGLEKAYVSQLRSAERKRQGLPPLRVRKGGKAAKARKAAAKAAKADAAPTAVAAPTAAPKSSGTASPVDITLFVMEMAKWQEKLGEKTLKAVLQTLGN